MDRKINKSGILKRIWPLLLLSLMTLFLSACIWTPTDEQVATLEPLFEAAAATQTQIAFCESEPEACKAELNVFPCEYYKCKPLYWMGAFGVRRTYIKVTEGMQDDSGNVIRPTGKVEFLIINKNGQFVELCTSDIRPLSNTWSSETADCIFPNLGPWPYKVTATYEGDEIYKSVKIIYFIDTENIFTPTVTLTLAPTGSSTNTPTITVTPSSISTNMIFSESPSSPISPGTLVTFSVIIQADSGDPNGEVNIISDNNSSCWDTLVNGSMQCSIYYASSGSFGVTATFTSTNGQHTSAAQGTIIVVEELAADEPAPTATDTPE